MRRWYVPLTVIGLGSLGAFLLTERGRHLLRTVAEKFWLAPEQLMDWDGSFENELDRIQQALNTIADSLNPRPQLGH